MGDARIGKGSTKASSRSPSRGGYAARITSALWQANLALSADHAHHIRYAQPRGLGLKVSDEFTVPLCAIHHGQIHETGKETEWWQTRNIDPLKAAADLWRDSRRAQSNLAKIGSSASAKLECHVAPADGADPTAAQARAARTNGQQLLRWNRNH